MKTLSAFSLGVLFVVACGSAPIVGPIGTVQEYIIDVRAQMLRAHKSEDDVPLEICTQEICYAYKDYDVRRIKKYIVELEEQLKACQKNGK